MEYLVIAKILKGTREENRLWGYRLLEIHSQAVKDVSEKVVMKKYIPKGRILNMTEGGGLKVSQENTYRAGAGKFPTILRGTWKERIREDYEDEEITEMELGTKSWKDVYAIDAYTDKNGVEKIGVCNKFGWTQEVEKEQLLIEEKDEKLVVWNRFDGGVLGFPKMRLAV